MIRIAFFDIGNVLLTIHLERVVLELSLATGMTEDIIGEILNGEIHDAYERGELTDREFYSGVMKKLSPIHTLTQEQFFSCWRGMLGKATDTLSYALSLMDSIPVWLASNTNRHHINEGGVGQRLEGFTGAVYSSDVGCRKPNEQFFRAMLGRSGASASESLFIDDRIENVTAAVSLGIKSIHYHSHIQLLEEVKKIEIIS
ncbi:MAG: HAD family phosphatase [Candidatus Neomarinimicrobiota bacterium]|nr:HAD family phosphatase [Candidatus Neomarinimicrobiota bacterium]